MLFALSASPYRVAHSSALSVLRNVILLLKQISSHFAILELLQISLLKNVSFHCVQSSKTICISSTQHTVQLTSQMCTVLQVVHALLPIALSHLFSYQSRHHALYPLLANDGILCRFQRLVVIVVDAVEGGRYRRLGCFEGLGFWSWHIAEFAASYGLGRTCSRLLPYVRSVTGS